VEPKAKDNEGEKPANARTRVILRWFLRLFGVIVGVILLAGTTGFLLLWGMYSIFVTFVLLALTSALVLFPACRIHRAIRRREARPLGPIARSFYFLPSLAVVLAGIHSRLWFRTTGLAVGTIHWTVLLLCSLYIGLSYMRRADSDDKIAAWRWVKSWPGWFKRSAPEPPDQTVDGDVARFLVLPGLAALTAITDTVTKAANLFDITPMASVVQVIFIGGALGSAAYALTATRDYSDSLGSTRKVLLVRRPTRLAAVAGAVVAVFFWAAGATYEPLSSVRIAAATLPTGEGRIVELTLVNQGQQTRVLREFAVESRTRIPFGCLSADFDIPLVAEYELKFHIAHPYTVIPARPVKQFQPQSAGRIRLALKPNATGACSGSWNASVRVSVVTDDDRRAITPWFRLNKRFGRDEVSPDH
jgi:hypothetical protein